MALTLFLIGVSTALFAHQFYISITYIQHDPGTNKLTVKVKLFVNDLEEAIYQDKGVRIGIWGGEPIPKATSYVKNYLASRFSLVVNGSAVPLKFLSQTVEPAEVLEDNVIICQLEATAISTIKTLKVRNSLLTETIDSQINIVNIWTNDAKKVINLDKRLPEDQVSFD